MDKLDLKIRQVKLARMKPVEKFMYEIFSNLIIYHYENIIYYKNNNKILLEYNNTDKILYCSNNLWKKLINDFNIKLQDIKNIFQFWINEFIKNIEIKSLIFL